MKEEYEKISKLRHRDRITNSDINFIQSMHNKYVSHLRKNICWQCPNSIREAMFDLFNYVEKNPLQDESKIITEQRPTEVGGDSEQVPTRSKGGKRSNGGKK
jgi:hypothetical protein